MISAAARNRRMSASPRVRPPRAATAGAVANSPAPMVPAPTASDVPKKERRLIELLKDLTLSSKLGFDVEVVNNDAVDLLIGFIWRLATPVASGTITHW